MEYLEENGEAIIEEFDDTGALRKKTRQLLVNLIFTFLNSVHDNKPSNDEIKAVCVQLNKIFPCIKNDPNDDNNIVS